MWQRYRKRERLEERTVTKRERKDIGWIIAAFALVFVVALRRIVWKLRAACRRPLTAERFKTFAVLLIRKEGMLCQPTNPHRTATGSEP